MNQEKLLALLEQAMIDDILELDCPICGETIRCEPDAKESWCYGCGQVVKTNNPLIELGFV